MAATRATRSTRSSTTKASTTKKEPLFLPDPQQLSSPPKTPSPAVLKRKATAKKAASVKKAARKPEAKAQQATPNSSRKRSRATVKKEEEEDINSLPHNLGKVHEAAEEAASISPEPPAKKSKRASSSKTKAVKDEASPLKDEDSILANDPETLAKKAATHPPEAAESATPSPKKKGKKGNNYGLTPGQTPFPEWPHPTAEECHEVTRLLSKKHGEVHAPKAVPPPSLNVSGCGEVPSVLDALIRTRLSAATSGTNSSRAFKGLVDRFGILKTGVGKGSVNWDAVRLAEQKEVFEAIKSGGLANNKSKDIKEILQMVWEENQARREALEGEGKGPTGAQNETDDDKTREVERAEQNVLSLDHLHAMSSDEAFNKLVKYPGIGVKTASCVLLFCLQRPSFAVDTHVFRLSKWLNWVPPTKATRDTTFSHLETRIPDDLKYPLHQLFIRHGKTCPRCRAATGEGSKDWEGGCPIEHLVKRDGARKGGNSATPRKSKGGKKGKRVDSDDEEEAEMSGVGSDEGDEEYTSD